jgi:hypothetical protein
VNTIAVRHDLDHHQKALLTALGWSYVIRADAPACVSFAGRNLALSLDGPPCEKCAATEAAA